MVLVTVTAGSTTVHWWGCLRWRCNGSYRCWVECDDKGCRGGDVETMAMGVPMTVTMIVRVAMHMVVGPAKRLLCVIVRVSRKSIDVDKCDGNDVAADDDVVADDDEQDDGIEASIDMHTNKK